MRIVTTVQIITSLEMMTITKIFLDPGHGGSDPGATRNGLREKDLTLEIAKRTQKYLNENFTGHQIKLSRTTDVYLSLSERARLANAWKADVFVSIHINAGGGTGYEDFIYNGLSDSSNTAKSRNTFHSENAKEQSFWRNRGKKKANFAVLRLTNMSGILTENGFIDTKSDADKLKLDAYLNRIAKGHAEGLAQTYKLKRKPKKEVKPVAKEVNHTPSPTHAKAWEKAEKKGIMNGKNPHNAVTREQLATVLDRLGLLD